MHLHEHVSVWRVGFDPAFDEYECMIVMLCLGYDSVFVLS